MHTWLSLDDDYVKKVRLFRSHTVSCLQLKEASIRQWRPTMVFKDKSRRRLEEQTEEFVDSLRHSVANTYM